jgi:hypothetical protein
MIRVLSRAAILAAFIVAWLSRDLERRTNSKPPFRITSQDPFGARLIKAGVSADTIRAWSVDPQVSGKSLFDQLEDTDSNDCIAKAVALAPKKSWWFW